MKRSRHTPPPRRVTAWAVIDNNGIPWELERTRDLARDTASELNQADGQSQSDYPFRAIRLTGQLPVKRGNKGRKG